MQSCYDVTGKMAKGVAQLHQFYAIGRRMLRAKRHPGELLLAEIEWRWLEIWCGMHGVGELLSLSCSLDKTKPKKPSIVIQSVAAPEDLDTADAEVWVQYDRLPFIDDSIPNVLCSHLFEIAHYNEAALSEAVRIVKPGGYVIVFGYHKYSLLGLQKSLQIEKSDLPNLSSRGKVRHMLLDLGLTLVEERMIAYRPLIATKERFDSFLPIEIIGPLLFRSWGSLYGIIARKDKLGYVSGAKVAAPLG